MKILSDRERITFNETFRKFASLISDFELLKFQLTLRYGLCLENRASNRISNCAMQMPHYMYILWHTTQK